MDQGTAMRDCSKVIFDISLVHRAGRRKYSLSPFSFIRLFSKDAVGKLALNPIYIAYQIFVYEFNIIRVYLNEY